MSRAICNIAVKVLAVLVPVFGVLSHSHATNIVGDPTGSNPRNNAEFAFEVNAESCQVTINSNRNIRRVAFRDESGRTIFARGVRRGQSSVTGFGELLESHPDGQISIRTRDGIWTRLDARVNMAVALCLIPDEPACPCFRDGAGWGASFATLSDPTSRAEVINDEGVFFSVISSGAPSPVQYIVNDMFDGTANCTTFNQFGGQFFNPLLVTVEDSSIGSIQGIFDACSADAVRFFDDLE
jgi:hypothetical protein